MTTYIFWLSLGIIYYLLFLSKGNKMKQFEREVGLERHQIKNGTPTMGGIVFVLPLIIYLNKKNLFISISTILFYLIGFIDDILKYKRKNNLGLTSFNKFMLQVVFAVISTILYFFIKEEFNIVLFFIYVLAFVSSSNAYNLTDGCDGLLSSLCLIMGSAWIIILNNKNDIVPLTLHLSVLGLISAFLYFNINKAYIFMGDTGSLFLGAYFCALAINYKTLSTLIITSGIIIFETLSVIIQVVYFKVSKGKRIFKMAPFHHHLEALDMSEVMVNLTFILIEVVLVIISLLTGGYL